MGAIETFYPSFHIGLSYLEFWESKQLYVPIKTDERKKKTVIKYSPITRSQEARWLHVIPP